MTPILKGGGGPPKRRVSARMEAARLCEVLVDLLDEHLADLEDAGLPADDLAGANVETFGDAGVLTDDPGFVVTLRDGSELQVTVIRSRN